MQKLSWMRLSPLNPLVYVLRQSGVAGRLTAGRVEADRSLGLMVYTGAPEALNEYISGVNVRSWCIFEGDVPIAGWCHVLAEDVDIVCSSPLPGNSRNRGERVG